MINDVNPPITAGMAENQYVEDNPNYVDITQNITIDNVDEIINRLKEEYVITRNPYNHNQLTRYDLSPSEVDAIIFCSKNYKPILEHMHMIEKKYSLFCLMPVVFCPPWHITIFLCIAGRWSRR